MMWMPGHREIKGNEKEESSILSLFEDSYHLPTVEAELRQKIFEESQQQGRLQIGKTTGF